MESEATMEQQCHRSECCRETDQKYNDMRSEFETIKRRMSDRESENEKYVNSLKEIISFRDDLLSC